MHTFIIACAADEDQSRALGRRIKTIAGGKRVSVVSSLDPSIWESARFVAHEIKTGVYSHARFGTPNLKTMYNHIALHERGSDILVLVCTKQIADVFPSYFAAQRFASIQDDPLDLEPGQAVAVNVETVVISPV